MKAVVLTALLLATALPAVAQSDYQVREGVTAQQLLQQQQQALQQQQFWQQQVWQQQVWQQQVWQQQQQPRHCN